MVEVRRREGTRFRPYFGGSVNKMDRKESRGEWRMAAVTRVENLKLTLVGLFPSNSIASSSKNPVCSTSKINAESEYLWFLCSHLPPSYISFLRTSPTEPLTPRSGYLISPITTLARRLGGSPPNIRLQPSPAWSLLKYPHLDPGHS